MDEFIREQTLFAEPILHVGGFAVTNSLIMAWASVFFITIGVFVLFRRLSIIPGRIQGFLEMAVEYFFDMFDAVTGSRQKSRQLFPLIFGLFVFILVNNYLGLLPGVGSIGKIEVHGAENLFVPVLRGATADLNTTLALALIAVFVSHILGVFKLGIWIHINKFVNIVSLVKIPALVFRNPSVALAKAIEVFSGLIEIVGEIAKVASLSLRLFGNIFAGEILLFSIAGLVAYLAPIPFMFLELLVGVIQALVFSMLTLVFITLNTNEHGH